jgi:lipopolysaccharide transport system permease protein
MSVDVLDIPVVRVEPPRRWLVLNVKELWAYRDLLYFFSWRDVKIRYKQTAIGALWAVIQPLMTMVVFTLVFNRVAKIAAPNDVPYPLFAFTALLPWTYFAKALQQSIVSVVSDANLITKVYFPRLFLPLSSIFSGLVDLAISSILLVVMMAWYGVWPDWRLLWLPVLVVLTMLTVLSISLWLSVINVRYRDVGQALPLLIQLWTFASPVAYPLSDVPADWRLMYSLNPMVGVIEGFRWALLPNHDLPVVALLVSTTMGVVALLGGLVFFKRMETTFADVI